jgi:site-specific DNA recombinase
MANSSYFQPAFDRLASDGAIGDPNGKLAYAYIRVSDSDQAEEGRSGLSRQLEHIHEAASKHGYKIPWDFVFADDYTGFQIEGRPELTRLRREYKSASKRANVVVIEHLDRLSRNADWHQGFLLDEMQQHSVHAIFWREFSSRIERAVMGAISQEGMEQAKERMKEGIRKKAQSGRITAKVPAFGYKFVDREGNENTIDARRDTYYMIDEDRQEAVRFVFEGLAYRGWTCYELRKQLDERGRGDWRFRPPRAPAWNERTLVKMIRNPLYKGEYIANRHYIERVIEVDEQGLSRTVLKSRQRPKEDWIQVPIPAIIDEQTWELANHNLYRNKDFARRNKKHEYMLSALVRCATCGRRYHGNTDIKPNHTRRYYCARATSTPVVREHFPCGQKSIRCEILDALVWEAITDALLNPEALHTAIDARYSNDRVVDIRKQIDFLTREIPRKEKEEQRLYQAYLAEAYTPDEYAGERKRTECVKGLQQLQ